MTQFVPKEQLWNEFPGGELPFEYDHDQYWPALWKLCQEKRTARRKRWILGGSLIGEYEDFLTGYSTANCSAIESKKE